MRVLIVLFILIASGRLAAKRSLKVPFMQVPVLPLEIRNDSQGQGHFGASRKTRVHQGLDLVVFPGQTVFSPIEGKVTRYAYPYASDLSYSGLEISGSGRHEGYQVKIFYLQPSSIGQHVSAGSSIGRAQAISQKYGGGMKDHIHVEFRYQGQLVDPTPFFQG